MEVIKGGIDDGPAQMQPDCKPYPWWRRAWIRIVQEVWWFRLHRWIPKLVWIDDEIDVRVTWTEDPLQAGNEFGALFSGGLWEIEKRLRNMGIAFDSGAGCEGRDWEWDYSLDGPVHVRFKGRAARPQRRGRRAPEPPKPRVVA